MNRQATLMLLVAATLAAGCSRDEPAPAADVATETAPAAPADAAPAPTRSHHARNSGRRSM